VIGRSHTEVTQLFGDFEIIPPGVTWAPLWHPEEATPGAPVVTFDTPAESAVLAGVARKPYGPPKDLSGVPRRPAS
jgi:S-adenosyl methyltransferase